MLSYSNRDFNSILEDLKKQIPQLTDQWTDFNKSDLGMVLLQTIAGISAMANFYIDKESNENFIGLAKEGKNIESILELIGYQKPLRKCAMATQVIQITLPTEGSISRDSDIVLPRFFQIYNQSKSISCFLPYELRIRPDEYEVETIIYQGIPRSKTYKNSNITGYKFYLPSGKYAQHPFRLFIDGVEWEQVDNAFLALEGGCKFSLHRDAFDSHYILLTHDYERYVSATGNFTIEYVLTEGEIAIKPYDINNVQSKVQDEQGNIYSNIIRTYNKETFTGGFTENDPYYERARLQRQLKVMDRLVTLDDYNNFVSTYPGIIDCEVSDMSVLNTTNPKPYQIDIFVLCNTLTPMGDGLRQELSEKIKSKQDFRNEFFLRDGKFIPVNMDIRFTTKASALDIPLIESKIINTIKQHYKDLRFKKPILIDEVLSIILRNVPEVYTVDVLAPTYDIYPSIGEVVMLRDIKVTGGVYSYGL